jgi:c-di-GMP-binding flagellar brake protein YcgR
MVRNVDDFLDGASREELIVCIQLLGLNLGQHRAKFGLVPLGKSVERLRARTDDTKDSGIFLQGNAVLEEAVELARALSTEGAVPAAKPAADSPSAEKRQQLRINITAPVKVLWPEDSTPVKAQLENISWGGAVLSIERENVEVGDRLRLLLPNKQSGSIAIEANILRTWNLAEDRGQRVAIRFSSIRTRDEPELEKFLELLSRSTDSNGQRSSARLTQRLELEFHDIEELQATLDDISAGGLGITVPEPLQIGQSLQTVISTFDESCTLKLRARVVRQDAIKLGKTEVYRAGLKFEHPTEELRERTEELIRNLTKSKHSKDG